VSDETTEEFDVALERALSRNYLGKKASKLRVVNLYSIEPVADRLQ
jgi:hypothetical protein